MSDMYLLDTSVVSDMVNPRKPTHASTMQFVNGITADQINICAVTLGEMEFGREMLLLRTPPPAQERIDEVDAMLKGLRQFAQALPITHHVARDYGRLRAAYANGVLPNALGAKLKGKPVELWHQQVPPSLLQITENDLWIAATAVTHDLVLATRDKDFNAVQRHFPQLKLMQI